MLRPGARRDSFPPWKSGADSYRETMSTLTKTLIEEIRTAPEAIQRQVFDYLVFLKTRRTPGDEGRENLLPVAQSAWVQDWSSPQEDEAWSDL